jgi:proteasome lid subunit RPN8/RPN11
MMRIKWFVVNSLIEHALQDAPLEACGYLAEKDGVVETHMPLTNIDVSQEHFSLDPKEQFDAVRAIRSQGMTLRAVYHSHPASPARPSEEDIRLAFDPDLSYVIVSLENGTSVKSFHIDGGKVSEEEIELVQS